MKFPSRKQISERAYIMVERGIFKEGDRFKIYIKFKGREYIKFSSNLEDARCIYQELYETLTKQPLLDIRRKEDAEV